MKNILTIGVGCMLVLAAFFAFFPTSVQAADSGLVPCNTDTNTDGSFKNPCGFDDMVLVVANITRLLLILGISIAAIVFAYAGILYMTAAGSPEQISEAHKIFGKVLIGFILMLSAWLIVKFIQDQLVAPEFQNLEEFTGQ